MHSGGCSFSSYRLFDQALSDGIPDYQQPGQYNEGTYLLFPDQTSVPLSSVVATRTSPLKRLVVLDCKWSNSSMRLHPHLAGLPKVHLDDAPESSYFWRWHSAGKGRLSTVEAIYHAAAQVAEQLKWSEEDQEQLVHLLCWLATSSYLPSLSRKQQHPFFFFSFFLS
jgi:DTW domain-containing protein YfiP